MTEQDYCDALDRARQRAETALKDAPVGTAEHDEARVTLEAIDHYSEEIANTSLRPWNQVRCSICHEPRNAAKAHLHQGEYIGDECCWDERLRASE